MSKDIIKDLSNINVSDDHWVYECAQRAIHEIKRRDTEIARLRGALRFYAEPWKYTDCHGDDVRVPDFYSELDFGETARAALAGEEKD